MADKLSRNIPSATIAAEQTTTIDDAPADGRVVSASFTPSANITGDDTDYRTLTLTNKGADGNGTTSVATLEYVADTDSTDYNETAATLSGTAADLLVAEGDTLAVVETVAGAGLVNPGGLFQVEVGSASYSEDAPGGGVAQTQE